MPQSYLKFIKRIALLTAIFTGAFFQNLQAQSVLNPADPLITYDPNNPPAQPAFGQIGKWVRTVRLSWNTEKYKAYIYKGMAFRLHFPKTYNPTAIDGKKYPMLVFFHGHGEYGPIYDNEFHLLLGHQGFSDAINFGIYDGYILSAQSTSYFGQADYVKLIEIIQYMIANNKLDPFHITANGLSQGGQATWEFLHDYPTYVSSGSSMSWTQYSYSETAFINTVKYSPIWVFQGGKDVNPYPSITYQVRDAMLAAGAQFKLTEYPEAGHGTWWAAWSERDFWPFQKRSYSSNPWQLGGKIDFWPATPINATLGLAPGFSAYEWRKDGVLIAGASSNTLNVTQTGVYSARVQRNGLWSEWSRIPITIKYKTFTVLPGRVEAENWGAMGGTQKDYGVQTEWTGDGTSGLNVGWIDQGDWMEYNINPSSAGNYTVNLRVATPNSGAQLKIKKQDGTLLTTVNLPNTGGWQVWQTVSGVISLPAGNQIIKIESSAIPVWNFNWMDFTNGGVVNQPPTANAGTDKTITLPTSSVSLTGSGTDADGTIASYAWTKVSGPAGGTITSPSSASTTITGLAQGSYVFRLTVMDNQNATGTDDVMVTVNSTSNQSPTANAGTDKSITLPTSSVSLTGSGTDADGTIASYAWTKVSGPAGGTITSPSSATTTVTGLAQGSYVFRLTVRDNLSATGTDDVTVTVNATASNTIHIEAENWSSMSGVQTEPVYDAGGGLNVGWIEFGDWMNYQINPASTGTYTIRLRIATPNNGAQLQIKKGDGTVLGTVNLPNTGAYQTWQTTSTTISLAAGSQTIRLQSSASPGWNINWLEISGGGTPTNQPPTANAGPNQTITLPTNSVTLNGSGTDPDGTIASYAWSKISGPSGSTITSPSSASTSVTGLVQGSYVFRLTVTDNLGASGNKDVTVTVNPAIPPSSTIHIEAENWSSMSGVQTEMVYDAGGGLNVGWIDLGDWMNYTINPSVTGTYTVKLRIATPNNGAQLQIKKADGTVLATVTLPNTGAYQSWQTVSTTLTLAQGTQTIRIQSSSAAFWNINWFELIQGVGTTTTSIETEELSREITSSIVLYPNPVLDHLILSINNSYTGSMKVKILNLSGAIIRQYNINKVTEASQTNILTGDLPKGQYLLVVEMKEWKEAKKLIKL